MKSRELTQVEKLRMLESIESILKDIASLYNNVELYEGYMVDIELNVKYPFSAPYQGTEKLIEELGFVFLGECKNGWENDTWYYYGYYDKYEKRHIITYNFCAYYNFQNIQFENDEFSPKDYEFVLKVLDKVQNKIISVKQ